MPRLMTAPLPAPVKTWFPDIKLASLMLIVDATRPPTLTDEPLPNKMPLGFSRNTVPLEVRLPIITDGSAPNTRFNATELLPGCTNCTEWSAPMLKLCQLITAFELDCVMVVLLPACTMFALPAATTPPVGEIDCAFAAVAIANNMAAANECIAIPVARWFLAGIFLMPTFPVLPDSLGS